MFKWKKKGQIWAPSKSNSWAEEYGQTPNAIAFPDRIRIYFGSRKRKPKSEEFTSYIFCIDVDKKDPSKILCEYEAPVFNVLNDEKSSEFDGMGTMPGSFIVHPEDKNKIFLYYVGWSKHESFPYRWATGLASSTNNGLTFKREKSVPILKSSYEFPFLNACARVFYVGKNDWRMWFSSGLEWLEHNERLNPVYVIKKATSKDGIDWEINDQQCIASKVEKECQSSFNLMGKDGTYHAIFAYRDLLGSNQYRIGYASSKDLLNWERDDSKSGIDVSPSGWDSTAICYPHILKTEEKTYMFYSGNRYGVDGFGYAELEHFPQ